MTPRQTLAPIVCSVALAGLAAGIVAVPAGVFLHDGVVPVMAHAASSGYPPSLISLYAPWELVLLELAGLIIAVARALGPAGWAARARTAFALRAEQRSAPFGSLRVTTPGARHGLCSAHLLVRRGQ
jgi:putative ABC transport system permease protein